MSEYLDIPSLYGSSVFSDKEMRARLPREIYKRLAASIATGEELDPAVADATASAMKAWAIEQGATHYTHWFQPLTGTTAEKHDSFISPQKDGSVIMELRGKELIRGEPDASSFPSGGIRATFEARGYTVWDITSPAFLYDNGDTKTLCIPTAFCGYNGEALDQKTPLLRSMEAVSRQAVRICRLFGDNLTQRVTTSVGPEQEYFIVDRETYLKRKDLIFTGRTLFGAMPPKGQEMEDHYFGAIKERVSNYMKDLDIELWKLGIPAKTEHNEAAPAQHELAPIYNTTNVATDENMLVMNVMKKVALRHGLVCLLHEKPFAGVNGSGKHNNWSLTTDTGHNLLEPGRDPQKNWMFLLVLAAMMKAVDEHAGLLRMSAANPGNDHRLGANEAPPAIISMFLGDQLTAVVDHIIRGSEETVPSASIMRVGVSTLPFIRRDATDRNRTSPFAFTGNKFEFRMPGSSQSIAGPTTVLNTIIADSLCVFADELEKASDFTSALHELIKRTFKEHGRILFGGNGYDESWVAEAEKRGLKNLKNSSTALPEYMLPKNIELLTKYGVYTESEIIARNEIHMEHYCKVIAIEGETLVDMVQHGILNAVSEYTAALSETLIKKRKALPEVPCRVESALIGTLSSLNESLLDKMVSLKSALETAPSVGSAELMKYYHDEVFLKMEDMRAVIDKLETLTATEYWPYPSYYDMLFSV